MEVWEPVEVIEADEDPFEDEWIYEGVWYLWASMYGGWWMPFLGHV